MDQQSAAGKKPKPQPAGGGGLDTFVIIAMTVVAVALGVGMHLQLGTGPITAAALGFAIYAGMIAAHVLVRRAQTVGHLKAEIARLNLQLAEVGRMPPRSADSSARGLDSQAMGASTAPARPQPGADAGLDGRSPPGQGPASPFGYPTLARAEAGRLQTSPAIGHVAPSGPAASHGNGAPASAATGPAQPPVPLHAHARSPLADVLAVSTPATARRPGELGPAPAAGGGAPAHRPVPDAIGSGAGMQSGRPPHPMRLPLPDSSLSSRSCSYTSWGSSRSWF